MRLFLFPDDMMLYLKYTIYGTRTLLDFKDTFREAGGYKRNQQLLCISVINRSRKKLEEMYYQNSSKNS